MFALISALPLRAETGAPPSVPDAPRPRASSSRTDDTRWVAGDDQAARELSRLVNSLPAENQWYAQPPAKPVGTGGAARRAVRGGDRRRRRAPAGGHARRATAAGGVTAACRRARSRSCSCRASRRSRCRPRTRARGSAHITAGLSPPGTGRDDDAAGGADRARRVNRTVEVAFAGGPRAPARPRQKARRRSPSGSRPRCSRWRPRARCRDASSTPTACPEPSSSRPSKAARSRATRSATRRARRIAVWLPPSYAARARRAATRCIYWLAGYAGTGEMLFSGGRPGSRGWATGWIGWSASGAMGEAIVVAPDGFTALGRRAVPRFAGDRQLRDAHRARGDPGDRRALPHRRRRATRAPSAASRRAGFGALALAMRNPELFAAVASHAGDMYFELSLLPDLPVAVRTLAPARRRRRLPAPLRRATNAAQGRRRLHDHAWCWRRRARIRPIRDARTASRCRSTSTPARSTGPSGSAGRAWDPVEMVAHARRGAAADEADLRRRRARATNTTWTSARASSSAGCSALGIACEHQEFDDGHRGTAYRYDVSLPKLAAAIGAAGRLRP